LFFFQFFGSTIAFDLYIATYSVNNSVKMVCCLSFENIKLLSLAPQ